MFVIIIVYAEIFCISGIILIKPPPFLVIQAKKIIAKLLKISEMQNNGLEINSFLNLPRLLMDSNFYRTDDVIDGRYFNKQ